MIEIPHNTVRRMIGNAVVGFIENEKGQPRHSHESMCQGIDENLLDEHK